MPNYLVRYTGPEEMELEAENSIEAELEMHELIAAEFDAEEIEEI